MIKFIKDETVPRDDVYKSHAVHVPSGEPPNSVSRPRPPRKAGVVRPITKGKLLRPGGPSSQVRYTILALRYGGLTWCCLRNRRPVQRNQNQNQNRHRKRYRGRRLPRLCRLRSSRPRLRLRQRHRQRQVEERLHLHRRLHQLELHHHPNRRNRCINHFMRSKGRKAKSTWRRMMSSNLSRRTTMVSTFFSLPSKDCN